MTSILKINATHPESEFIDQAAQVILNEGVIGYPTETVYGLGANIFSETAVNRIFSVKGRDAAKAILVIVPTIHMLDELVLDISNNAFQLMHHFWPGPLTLIFKAGPSVSRQITGGSPKIAVRIPNNKICLELLNRCNVPLTSTSANFSGAPNPLSAQDVARTLGKKLDLIIDGGPSLSQIPSTILDVTSEPFRLIRKGAIAVDAIERICKIETA